MSEVEHLVRWCPRCGIERIDVEHGPAPGEVNWLDNCPNCGSGAPPCEHPNGVRTSGEEWLGEPFPPGTENVPQYVVTAAMERLVEQREALDRTLQAMANAVGFAPKRAGDVKSGDTIRLRGAPHDEWHVVAEAADEVPPDAQPLRKLRMTSPDGPEWAFAARIPAYAWIDVRLPEPQGPF
jgi:ribosomal protein S27AE